VKTLTVPIADETFERLKDVARPERRHPRMQAAAILTGVLSDDEREVLGAMHRLLGRLASHDEDGHAAEPETGDGR
jgi:hypothetical protein